MYSGGDAAEQVVRLSLEGFDVAARLTGSAAKNVALLLAAALKEEHKTKGKTRLTNMIRSGKELKVFSIPNRDLPKFIEQAKRYGVLYCVLKDKEQKDGSIPVDIIARAEDASKIQRIFERFELGVVDKASIVTEAEKDKAERGQREGGTEKTAKEDNGLEKNISEGKLTGEQLFDELLIPSDNGQNDPDMKAAGQAEEVVRMEGETVEENPTEAVTEKDPLSAQNSGQTDLFSEPEMDMQQKKPSVKEKLEQYRQEAKEQRAAAKEKSKQKDRAGNAAKRNSRKKSKQKKKQANNRKER